MTTTLDETEAAALEGFVAIDNDKVLVGMVWAYKTFRRVAKKAKDDKGKLADRLMKALTDRNATVFTIGGQSMVRKQTVHATTIFDMERFKKEHPALHKDYMTKTKVGSIKIWVRPQDGDDFEEDEVG